MHVSSTGPLDAGVAGVPKASPVWDERQAGFGWAQLGGRRSQGLVRDRFPYGNKEVAFNMGVRYGADGWYAPSGIDLDAFRERG